MAQVTEVVFGQYMAAASQVFFKSKYCLGLVNLMPVKPGHVLLIPKRKVHRFKDLSTDEASDLMLSAQKVVRVLEGLHNSSSMTIAIQDGPDAGQTVFHVHMHLIPRVKGDFARNDDVYTEIEKPREKRTEADMAKEASMLAAHFPENDQFSLLLD